MVVRSLIPIFYHKDLTTHHDVDGIQAMDEADLARLLLSAADHESYQLSVADATLLQKGRKRFSTHMLMHRYAFGKRSDPQLPNLLLFGDFLRIILAFARRDTIECRRTLSFMGIFIPEDRPLFVEVPHTTTQDEDKEDDDEDFSQCHKQVEQKKKKRRKKKKKQQTRRKLQEQMQQAHDGEDPMTDTSDKNSEISDSMDSATTASAATTMTEVSCSEEKKQDQWQELEPSSDTFSLFAHLDPWPVVSPPSSPVVTALATGFDPFAPDSVPKAWNFGLKLEGMVDFYS